MRSHKYDELEYIVYYFQIDRHNNILWKESPTVWKENQLDEYIELGEEILNYFRIETNYILTNA